ncbi:glutathione S-transferase family protein [Gilvimarinus xylanilyticus]|uniref:Glutathione S-transferase family protein n=1 Tax=Gilvimarinus xylanilyticus TaxID=2944139 RepID=A0A9X2KSC8_9GAMM|nr:glutathione S-transferase family protein [Gilvimarinus xylanilyticus]MCP8897688.1 glutathione S-transferase family protein [Gilvimarinus xylanilyticus]
MLINGQWAQDWQPVQAKDDEGRFIRQTSTFRHWVTPDGRAGPTGDPGFKAEAGRYHLYVAYICPWASRTLMALQLKGLAELISVSVVNPRLTSEGWRFGGFPGADEDPHWGAKYMHQIYTHADSRFTGRATVPVLWDKKMQTIVNNESADILRMLNTAFCSLTDTGPDLYPPALAGDIDALNQRLYAGLNNGVYQAGFASSQQAYNEAYQQVFATLDELENRLSDGRHYLFGGAITEADIRLFVTLVRFDAAYHGLFKCNRNTLASMPGLHAYMHRIWQLPGVAATVHLDHIKAGYYSVKSLNPSGIVPLGPEVF